MIGVPVSGAQFRAVNAIGSILIVLFSAVLPLVLVHVPRFHRAGPGVRLGSARSDVSCTRWSTARSAC